MDNIIIKKRVVPTEKDVEDLYNDANWSSYTNDLHLLMRAINESLCVVTVWDRENLVGLIRIVGDGLTIVYIQDILVKKAYKRKGIGSHLVNSVLEEYKAVRQKVLLTDDTPETRGFYETLGFMQCDKGQLVSFVKFG